jgi:ADP-L-glycero-D-manno-heptose 6-epimerase
LLYLLLGFGIFLLWDFEMYLITGSAGFIGSALVAGLNRKGIYDIILCDSLGQAEKWKNIAGLRYKQIVTPEQLLERISSFNYVDPHLRGVDTVVHLGACAVTTEADVDFLLENNTHFSQELCLWSLERGAHFIYASSAAVYGDGAHGFSDEPSLTPKLRPLNAYGFSKWAFDMWVLENSLYDRVVGLRFFNVFGPNEYHKDDMASVVYRSFPLALAQKRIRLFESHRTDYAHGEQQRDFVYIDEALEAMYFLLDHRRVHGIFNLGTGRAHTWNSLAKGIFKGLGVDGAIEYFPMPENIRDKYQYRTVADMSRLYATGFPPHPDRFEEYVATYVRNYLLPGHKRYQDL